jgi:DHA1 family tetracycline resistance protein-like MFS transporter
MSDPVVPTSEIPRTHPEIEPEPSKVADTSSRKAMFIVFLVVFIDLLGFGIVLPLLPIYGDRYVAQLVPGGKEAPAGGAIVGLLMASFSAMQFLFAPLWGRISDRVGRRPILLVGLAGSVVCYTVFGFASDLDPGQMALAALVLLFVARMGAGIAGATISTAQAVIADCTTPEKRKGGMALIGAAFGIGFTFGPLLGAGSLWFLPNHHGAIGYAAAGLSSLAFGLGCVLLPETRRFDTAPPLKRKWFDTQAIRLALGDPSIAPVVWCFFLATLGFGGLEVTLSLLNRDALGLEERQNFLPFAYVGFVLMLTQGFLYRRLAPRFSEATFMAAGIALMGVGVACLGVVTWMSVQSWSTPAALWTIVIFGLTAAVVGFAFLTPSAQALVSRRSDPARQGEILGVNQSASAMARILGPILFLTLYKAHSSHLLPYILGAGLLLAMLPLMPRIRRGG